MMKRIGLLTTLALSFVFSVLVWHQPAAAAPPIIVTIATDGINNDGVCSLREAIIAANLDSPFNGCTGGSGTDTIEFSPSVTTFILTLTGKNEDSSMSGDLDITDDLNIIGNGASITIINGNGSDRVFEIHPGIHATISGITVQNGNPGAGIDGGGILNWGSLNLSDSAVTSNQGSGISNDGGILTLTSVQVDNNSGAYGVRNHSLATLDFDGGTVNGNGDGGIYNDASTATLANLTINNNSDGGGVVSIGNTTLTRLTINQTEILTNTTTANGGGVYNSGNFATAVITASTISENSAVAVGGGAGGGIYNNGILTINDSTIDNNHARTGGGIEHSGSNLYMTNVTISANQANDDGGGLYNRSSAILTNVTLNGNVASGPDTGGNIFNDEAQMAIGNSIVANSPSGGNCFNSNGFLNSQGHNLDSGNSCGFAATGDKTSSNPLLGMLQDNGGGTFIHALSAGSPAIDMADAGMCPDTDQRGVLRPQGGGCDMGAYEVETAVSPDLTISIATSPLLVSVNSTLTYTLSITNSGTVVANNVIVTDTFSAEATYIDAFATRGGVCNYSGSVHCTLTSLAAGDSFAVTVVVNTPKSVGTIVNQGSVASDVADADPGDNVVVVETAVSVIQHIYLPLIQNN
ncbi:MAG: DUF11 domain-containing protein [Chloroflexi bacterium]|nr:DUF11 domain-containing protein [Chloroflexota bacterium]